MYTWKYVNLKYRYTYLFNFIRKSKIRLNIYFILLIYLNIVLLQYIFTILFFFFNTYYYNKFKNLNWYDIYSLYKTKFNILFLFFFFNFFMSKGRKKSNKYNSLLMYPFMMSGMTIPLAFGVLALLAGKALIIAKLALTLSALLGLKKMFSDDSNTHGYISNSGGHYRRSMPGESAASNMAYNSYMPGYEESIIRSTPTTSWDRQI